MSQGINAKQSAADRCEIRVFISSTFRDMPEEREELVKQIGKKPQLAELQRWLARELGDEAMLQTVNIGKECLRKLLWGRKAQPALGDFRLRRPFLYRSDKLPPFIEH